MKIGPLLAEQRRIGDEFRVTEKSVQELQKLLSRRGIDAGTRVQMETAMASSWADLSRLGQRMLELDASVSVAAMQP